MTNEVTQTEQTIETPKPKDISDPNIGFADYEKLRRGETLSPETSASAPVHENEKGQKENSESETEKTEAEDKVKNEESEDHESEDDHGKSDENKPKKKGGFQRRIDKLNAQKTAAQQELEYWRKMALNAGAGVPKAEKTDSKPAAAAEVKPSPDKFETHTEYVEALADWTTEHKLKEHSQKLERSKLETEQQTLVNAHSERVKTFAEKTEDFQDVLSDVDDIPLSPAVQQLIVSSQNGPELMYELAKNREAFEKLNQLSPLAAAREIGKLETRLEKASPSKPETKKLTQAPKPITPVGGNKSSATNKSPEEMSYSEYEKYRRDQMKRKRGR